MAKGPNEIYEVVRRRSFDRVDYLASSLTKACMGSF